MAFMKLAMETRLRNGVITNPIRFSGYAAQDLNTWAYVQQQQHAINPSFTGGGSDTNSFLP